jgi:hypothetical protein
VGDDVMETIRMYTEADTIPVLTSEGTLLLEVDVLSRDTDISAELGADHVQVRGRGSNDDLCVSCKMKPLSQFSQS